MANDIASLFASGDSAPSAHVRQGVVEAWNAATGENTIRVAGGELLNVPSLTGESASLHTGDVVALLSAGNRWFLLGKVTTPGDPGTVPTWTVDITALTGQVDTIQTVTIPAVQADVTVVQGDVVEINTVTIPAVQADADAAQATADQATIDAAAAQADADALQVELDAAEADVAAVTANVATLTGTTLPGLVSNLAAVAADVAAAQADVAAAQADVDAILPIGTTDISDDAITTPKIAAGQITAVKIAADTITAAQIAASAITASELAANAVTAGKIAAGTIVAADIASGTITATQIAANTITAAKIAAGTITATEIASGTITGTKLSADAIDGKTITGALFRTAASGERVQIDSTDGNRVKFHSGVSGEMGPGFVRGGSPGSGFAWTQVAAPRFYGSDDPTSSRPNLTLSSDNSGTAIATSAVLEATVEARLQLGDDAIGPWGARLQALGLVILSAYTSTKDAGIVLDPNSGVQVTHGGVGSPVFTFNGADVVTDDDTQTLTHKNLTSSTNTFPSIPFSLVASGTTDANGFLTVTHGAGFTPVGGWWVCTNPGSSFAQFWGIDTIGATTVRLRFCSVATFAALASTAVVGRLFLVK